MQKGGCWRYELHRESLAMPVYHLPAMLDNGILFPLVDACIVNLLMFTHLLD